jgi:hypothetical protein
MCIHILYQVLQQSILTLSIGSNGVSNQIQFLKPYLHNTKDG